MKILILFVLSLNIAFAVNVRDLDLRQQKIAHLYAETNRDIPDLAGINEAALRGDKETVAKSINLIRKFFEAYDQYNLDKIDYFFEAAVLRAREEALDHIKHTGKLPKKAGKWLKELEAAYAEYNRLKIHFGTEQDMARLDVGQTVLHKYAEFAKAIRKSRGEKPWRNFGPAKIVPFVDNAPDFLKVSGKFLNLLWASYFRGNTGMKDRAPIPEALAGAQRKLVKMRHVQTRWDGLENIDSVEHDGKTLNMFLINHANSFFDTSAQQTFPIKGMSSMGNVDIFFPAFLARRMVKSDHMITVGHGDTTGKTIELVRKKQLNRFFLAIEGITGVGLFEMRPVMPLFNFAVYDAIERGLELKLYPIAFPDNFRLMNDWRSPIEGPRTARGVVLPPINTQVCLSLREMTESDDAISQLIRWNWFATLKNSEDTVLAMPYPSVIKNNLERMIWGMD